VRLAEVNMADGDKWPAGGLFRAGPWQWQWRRQHRRRRRLGCFLWLLTLLLVLLVLSLLFGGFRRGTRDGGEARLVPVSAVSTARISGTYGRLPAVTDSGSGRELVLQESPS
jgi:hypothetical protein